MKEKVLELLPEEDYVKLSRQFYADTRVLFYTNTPKIVSNKKRILTSFLVYYALGC